MYCYYCKNKCIENPANEFGEQIIECKKCDYLYYLNVNNNNIIELNFHYNSNKLCYWKSQGEFYQSFYCNGERIVNKSNIFSLENLYKNTTPANEREKIKKMLKSIILK